jgi:quinol monooxygenase YgiN
MDRFLITVDFDLLPGALDPFIALIKENARKSLAEEPGCHRFDVLVQRGVPDHILLYEIYKNRAAFEVHLKSRHFAEFNTASAPYVKEKKVIEYEYVNDVGK